MVSNRLKLGAVFALGLTVLQAALAAPPPNDDVHNAAVIPSVPYSAFVDMPQATVSASDPQNCTDHDLSYNTVWYQYRPTASGSVDANMAPAPNQDLTTYIGFYTGTPDALTPVKCSDAYTEPANSTRASVTAGTNYYIQIGSLFPLASYETGTFSLVASPPSTAGTVSVASAATSYRELKYDPETLFYVVYHVVIDLQITCSPAIPSVTLNASVVQGDSSTSASGYTVSCTSGSATGTLDIAPTGPYGNQPFTTGPATATVTAYNYAENYNASVQSAPIYITVDRKRSR